MKWKNILIVCVMSTGLLSCQTVKTPSYDSGPSEEALTKVEKTGESLQQVSGELDKTSGILMETGGEMDSTVSKVRSRMSEKGMDTVVEPEMKALDTQADVVRQESEKIKKNSDKIEETAGILETELATLKEENSKRQKHITSLEKENEKLESRFNKLIRQKLMWLILAGIVMVTVGVVLCFSMNPKAIWGSVGGIVLIGTSFAVQIITDYAWMFGILFGAAVLTIIGVLIYVVLDHLDLFTGMKETVYTVEELKKRLTDEQYREFFGPSGEKGRAGQIQSWKTQKKVKRLKADS